MFSDIVARVSADGSGFMRTMNQLQGATGKLGSGLKGQLAAAFSATALTAFATSIARHAGEIKDLSESLDMSPENVQVMELMGNQAGVSMEKITGMLDKISAAKDEALSGDSNKLSMFESLGIDAAQLSKVESVESLVQTIASNYQNITKNSPEKWTQFNKSLADLLGVKNVRPFKAISEGMADIQASKKKFEGQYMSDQEIADNDQLSKDVEAGWNRIGVRFNKIVSPVLRLMGIARPDEAASFRKLVQDRLLWTEDERNTAWRVADSSDIIDGQKLDPMWNIPIDKNSDYYKKAKAARDARKLEAAAKDEMPNLPMQRLPTDSLLQVGNFLGQRTDLLNTTANKLDNINNSINTSNRILTEIKDKLAPKPVTTTDSFVP